MKTIKVLTVVFLLFLGFCFSAIASAQDQASAIYEGLFSDGFDVRTVPQCPAQIVLPDGTTRTLVTTADVSYGVYQAQRLHVDVTEWDNVWGHNTTTDTGAPWPGVGGAAPVIRAFRSDGYLCVHFLTSWDVATFNVFGRNGSFSNPSYVNGPNLTMSISTMPGDFTEGLPTDGCVVSDVATSDAAMVRWKGTSNAPASWCNLQPLTDYFVNIVFSTPSECAAPRCALGTVSYHN